MPTKIKNSPLEKKEWLTLDEFEQLYPTTPEDEMIIAQESLLYDIITTFYRVRKQMKMTQAELAARAGLPRSTVAKVESGKRNATVATLQAMAHAMGKTLKIELV